MKATFLALLHHLEISEDLGNGDRLNDTLRITNSRAVIERCLTASHRLLMGELEVQSLLAGAPVAIAEAAISSALSPEEALLARLYEVQGFLMSTWFVQDNSINCEMGFLLYEQGRMAGASNNFVAHLYSTSRGTKETTHLTRAQLREMRTLHRSALRIPEHPFQAPISQLTTSHPRLSRALLLINAARGAEDVAIKVSHYCTAFETLFSTSQSELSHQLSERLASYLYRSTEDRLLNYRKIKAAYSLRSKVVHGSSLREDRLTEAVELASYCDEQARKVFQRLLNGEESQSLFEQNAQSFDEEMLRRIFSDGRTD